MDYYNPTIHIQKYIFSRSSTLALREPLVRAVRTYISSPENSQTLSAVGTTYVVISVGFHTSRSLNGAEHITVEAYTAKHEFVKVIHIKRDGTGELLVPDANTLIKRNQNPLSFERV